MMDGSADSRSAVRGQPRHTNPLNELIDKLNNGDPDWTADAVFEEIHARRSVRDLFGALLRDQCRRRYRAGVAAHEFAATGHRLSDSQGPSAGGGIIDRTAYLADRFNAGGGRMVVWGEATVQDHRDRIAFLTILRNGYNATIDMHATAVESIEAAGATCLNDIAEVAA